MIRRFALYSLPLLSLTACNQADAPAVDETAVLDAIHAVETAQLAAMMNDDLAGATAPYAAEAEIIAPGADPVGGAQISGAFEAMMADDNFSITPNPDSARSWVATSGDLAVTSFIAQMGHSDKDGDPVTETIYNQTVWRKGADGNWQIVSDVNTYMAPAGDPAVVAAAAPTEGK